MILYKHQVVQLKRYNNRPGIYLGYDKDNFNRVWVLCIKHENSKPEIDWFNLNQLDYFKTKASNNADALPKGEQIFFGKFKQNYPNYIISEPEKTSEEDREKFIGYIKELIKKYQPKQDEE